MAFEIFMFVGLLVVGLAFLWAVWPLLTGEVRKKSTLPTPPQKTGNVLDLPFDPMESVKRCLALYTSPVGYLWQLKYSKDSFDSSVKLWMHLLRSSKREERRTWTKGQCNEIFSAMGDKQ